jgi:ABC-type antimicrobial peptide transport system permease subunit
MALGAQRRQVVTMVLREVLVVLIVGLAVGVPAASSATRISEALLFGVRRDDLATMAAAMAVLGVTAVAAAFGPALGAARVSPTVALRDE